jgi:signal transduction histidine kinase
MKGFRKSLLRLYYRRLWVRIAFVLLVIVTVPVVLLGFLLTQTSQEALRNAVLTDHKQIVIRSAHEIGLFLRRPRDIMVSTAALLGVVYPAPFKQETILVEMVLDQPIFMRAASVDMAGREIAGSELGGGTPWQGLPDAMKMIRTGTVYMSEFRTYDNRIPYLTMAVPIKKMGQIIGALIVDVNVKGVWEIIDTIRIGKTGRAFLVSDNGTLIADQDKKKVLYNENLRGEADVDAVLSGMTNAVELRSLGGDKFISSYAPIPDMSWGIVLRQHQNEAYFFSRIMMIQSWIIIIFAELLAIAVSIVIAHVFVAPIKTLSEKIKRVSEGDFAHNIAVRRRDDMGELIRSFNQMTKKLRKAKERERLSAIGEAAARITHELKNSFVALKIFIQLFPQRYKDELFIRQFSKLLPEELNRMDRMFQQLSDFSSLCDLDMVHVAVKELLKSIIEIETEYCVKKKITVSFDPGNEDFCIHADPDRLRQVFMNLIMNAVHAMPDGGSLLISIRSWSNEGVRKPTHVVVQVKDTGKGIPGHLLERIFEPFRTTKNGGMGLGLAISRKIIEQHQGVIQVESKVDSGTTFTVRLPVVARVPAIGQAVNLPGPVNPLLN